MNIKHATNTFNCISILYGNLLSLKKYEGYFYHLLNFLPVIGENIQAAELHIIPNIMCGYYPSIGKIVYVKTPSIYDVLLENFGNYIHPVGFNPTSIRGIEFHVQSVEDTSINHMGRTFDYKSVGMLERPKNAAQYFDEVKILCYRSRNISKLTEIQKDIKSFINSKRDNLGRYRHPPIVSGIVTKFYKAAMLKYVRSLSGKCFIHCVDNEDDTLDPKTGVVPNFIKSYIPNGSLDGINSILIHGTNEYGRIDPHSAMAVANRSRKYFNDTNNLVTTRMTKLIEDTLLKDTSSKVKLPIESPFDE